LGKILENFLFVLHVPAKFLKHIHGDLKLLYILL